METKNLLPFDLEVALKEPERVVFENGEKPLEWHYFKYRESPFKITTIDKNGNARLNTKEGFCGIDQGANIHNLRLLPKTVTLWSNVYLTSFGPMIQHGHFETKEAALNSRNTVIQYIGEPFSVEVEI